MSTFLKIVRLAGSHGAAFLLLITIPSVSFAADCSNQSPVQCYQDGLKQIEDALGKITTLEGQVDALRAENARLRDSLDQLAKANHAISDGLSAANAAIETQKSATHFIFVGQQRGCPAGWRYAGTIGVIMHNPVYANNLAPGGPFNPDWTWTHPFLCEN